MIDDKRPEQQLFKERPMGPDEEHDEDIGPKIAFDIVEPRPVIGVFEVIIGHDPHRLRTQYEYHHGQDGQASCYEPILGLSKSHIPPI